MLTQKILSSEADFAKFAEIYGKLSKLDCDPEALARVTKVIVFITRDGEWAGGYVLNKERPLRCLQKFYSGTGEHTEWAVRNGILDSDLVEICMIWKIRERMSWAEEKWFLGSVAVNLLQVKGDYILGASLLEKVWLRHHELGAKLIYAGTGADEYAGRPSWLYCWRWSYVELVTTLASVVAKKPLKYLRFRKRELRV